MAFVMCFVCSFICLFVHIVVQQGKCEEISDLLSNIFDTFDKSGGNRIHQIDLGRTEQACPFPFMMQEWIDTKNNRHKLKKQIDYTYDSLFSFKTSSKMKQKIDTICYYLNKWSNSMKSDRVLTAFALKACFVNFPSIIKIEDISQGFLKNSIDFLLENQLEPPGHVWKALKIMATDRYFREKNSDLNLSIDHVFANALTYLKSQRTGEYIDIYDEFKCNLLKMSDNFEEKNNFDYQSIDLKYKGLLIKNSKKIGTVPIKIMEIGPNCTRLDIVPVFPNLIWRHYSNTGTSNINANSRATKDIFDIHNARAYLIVKFVDRLTTVTNRPYNGYHFQDDDIPTYKQVQRVLEKGITVAGIHYSFLFYGNQNLYEKSLIMVSKDLLFRDNMFKVMNINWDQQLSFFFCFALF